MNKKIGYFQKLQLNAGSASVVGVKVGGGGEKVGWHTLTLFWLGGG